MTALLIACGALAREVIAIRDKYAWDAKVLAIPSLLHNNPQLIPDAVAQRIEANRADFRTIVIIYGDCGTGGFLDRRLEQLGVERIAGPHCYEMYAGDNFKAMMQEEPGTFFLTDYLVRSFDHLIIEGLGLDRFPELRNTYFGNYHRMIYLQQRDDPQLSSKAAQAAEMLQLPLEVWQTGYGELEKRLIEFMEK